ncbi:MAG: RHS repeat-associated core domain-containing protein [Gammaproteobacteria bacterium]
MDDSGNLINRGEYTPYGETSFGSFARKRYRFAGKERDEESGLYYHGARYYAPWLGRWVSCDPAGMVDGANFYKYSRNTPIKMRDPTGRASGEAPNVHDLRTELRAKIDQLNSEKLQLEQKLGFLESRMERALKRLEEAAFADEGDLNASERASEVLRRGKDVQKAMRAVDEIATKVASVEQKLGAVEEKLVGSREYLRALKGASSGKRQGGGSSRVPVEEPPIKPTGPRGTGVRSTPEAKPPGTSWGIRRVLGGTFTFVTVLYEAYSLYRGIVELPKHDAEAYHEGVKSLYFRSIVTGVLLGLPQAAGIVIGLMILQPVRAQQEAERDLARYRQGLPPPRGIPY